MPVREDKLVAAQYFTAVAGFAAMHHLPAHPSMVRERLSEITAIVEHADEFPNNLEIPVVEYDVDEGYRAWAPSYDGPNPAIGAGFEVHECHEPTFTESAISLNPAYAVVPDAVRQAFTGLPAIVVWRLVRR